MVIIVGTCIIVVLCACVVFIARGVDMEAANAKFKPAKAKALKVLDGKSAQNICEFNCLKLIVLILTLSLSLSHTTPPSPHFCLLAMLLGILRNNKVKLDSDGVKRLILSVDDEKLNEQLMAQLLKFLPSKEEMQQLGTYKDKLSDLSDAEQFGAMVCAVVYFIVYYAVHAG